MLAYVFRDLDLTNNKSSSVEEFENVRELYAEILYLSFSRILKQGIYKEYIEVSEDSPIIKGKLNLNETIKRMVFLKKQVHINYDVFSENNLLNQIIKATLLKFIRDPKIKSEQSRKLRGLLFYLSEVDMINLTLVQWGNIQWNRQNNFYQLAIEVCRLYIEELLLEDQKDGQAGAEYSKKTHDLFESFVRSLYERETNYDVSRPHIQWDVDAKEEDKKEAREFLPRMETDMVLKQGGKTLIIDTKYYEKNMNENNKHLSENLYQMFAYLKNYQQPEDLAGMLLYAKTDANKLEEKVYSIQKNKLAIKSIDLHQDFTQIKADLIKIADRMFEQI